MISWDFFPKDVILVPFARSVIVSQPEKFDAKLGSTISLPCFADKPSKCCLLGFGAFTLFHRGGGEQIGPHPAQTRIRVKNQWVDILIIFVYS